MEPQWLAIAPEGGELHEQSWSLTELAEVEFGNPEHVRQWILAVRTLRDERLVAREEAFFMVAWAIERLAQDRLGQPIRAEICWVYGQWEMARLLENDPAEFGRRCEMGRAAILGP
jgi:hypothetical protein